MNKLILVGLLAFAPLAANAQSVRPPDAAPAALAADQVDTSALAFYATRHDTARMNAELRRLRSLYPGWQPPADPASLASSNGDAIVQPLWDLFAADRLDELDAALAARKAANPAFAPPPELVEKLATKRARATLIAASDKKAYGEIIDLVGRNPGLVRPDDLEVSWSVADAYARTGREDKALQLDQTILQATKDPAARVATVRKAMLSLPAADLQTLLSEGRTGPDGRSEFDAVGLDLVRQRVGAVLAGTGPEPAAPPDIARLEQSAQAGSGDDAALLGWLASKQRSWDRAATWFGVALKGAPVPAQARPDDAKVAQGLVLALQALGRAEDAEALAYRWHDADPAISLLYLNGVERDLTRPKPLAVEEGRLKRFSELVAQTQSGDGAQALGWYAYNIGQFSPAEAWFRKAMAWQPRDSTALGLALSLKQGGDKAALAAFLAENGPTFPALAGVASGGKPPGPRATGAPHHRPTEAAALRVRVSGSDVRSRRRPDDASCAARGDGGTSSSALQAGWCLMGLERPREAALAFDSARRGAATADNAAYGRALADLRASRTKAAVEAAGQATLTSAHRDEIGLAALAQKAAETFDQGRYEDTLAALDSRRAFTPEPRDLAVLRGWSTYHLGDREGAGRIFSTLDQQLSTGESRAGLAATQSPTRN